MALAFPVSPPIRSFYGNDGKPLDRGFIYFGTANQNPETAPKAMFWDLAMALPVTQPVRTVGGFIVRQGTPANVFSAGDFSITIKDSKGRLVQTYPVSAELQVAQAVLSTSAASAIGVNDASEFFASDNVEDALAQIADDTPGNGFITLARLAADAVARLVPTGARFGYAGTTLPATGGYVWGNGATIGSASSGVISTTHQRANADTSALFTLFWNSYDNTVLHIQDSAGTPTTRGVSASADFTANKRMPTPDYRERVPAGLGTMGGRSTPSLLTAAGSGIDGTIMGSSGGVQTFQLLTTHLPAHLHAVTDAAHTHTVAHTHTISDPTHAHALVSIGGSAAVGGSGGSACALSGGVTNSVATGISVNTATPTTSSNNSGISTTTNTGGDTAHQNTQPTLVETTIIKL